MIKKIILSGLTAIWIVGFLICWNMFAVGPNYWIGFTFGLVGFIATGVCIFCLEKSNFSTTEIGYIPIYYTVVFVVLMTALNLSFAWIKERMFIPVFVVVNLAAILTYGVLVYGAVRHLLRVKDLTEYAPQKMKNTADISQQLAMLLSIAKDTGIRQELLKLKEIVAYSNNVSQQFSKSDEAVFLEKLCKIQEALSNGTDTEVVMNQIKDAATTWNIRNSSINSMR